uniref:Uncharacterized protein n=1 Tax=Coprothermobacter proteolyticus (strain ATCC 35245 / DSM 5265 / OCM 4 / BT) TaxID=309798 RepID=B5Y6F0_COPPD
MDNLVVTKVIAKGPLVFGNLTASITTLVFSI